jgi:adenylyl cyclase-associated protein
MSDLPALLKRLESVTGRLEELASKGGVATGSKPAANGTSGSSAAFVEAFDEILSGPVKQYLELSAKVGGLVNDQVCVLLHSL